MPNPPPPETPLRRLASHHLGASVHDWIRDRRPARKPWRQIAAELKEATNGEVDVTIQTLIKWAPDPKDDDDSDEPDVADQLQPVVPPVQRAAS